MIAPTRPLAAALAALILALPAIAQGEGNPGGLRPPGELFASPAPQVAAQPGKLQKLYNDASACSGHNAQLQAYAAMYTARALTESTRAQRAGDEQSATDLRAIFLNGVTIRDSAGSTHKSLEDLRAALAGRADVNDASGTVMYLSGSRRVIAPQLGNLPASGLPLVQRMVAEGDVLLGELDKALGCLTAVTSVDLTTP